MGDMTSNACGAGGHKRCFHSIHTCPLYTAPNPVEPRGRVSGMGMRMWVPRTGTDLHTWSAKRCHGNSGFRKQLDWLCCVETWQECRGSGSALVLLNPVLVGPNICALLSPLLHCTSWNVLSFNLRYFASMKYILDFKHLEK